MHVLPLLQLWGLLLDSPIWDPATGSIRITLIEREERKLHYAEMMRLVLSF